MSLFVCILLFVGESCLAREYRSVAALLAFTKQAYVEYKPLGVIGIIVPWNYPFQNVLSAVVAALMAGNGAVVKVSEYASFSAERIEQVFREILARRGHNPDLVQVVTGFAETGSALVSSGVDKILFIGSPAVGKLVMRAASATLTPVILELGGKDPFIVFDDAEFEQCVDVAIRGAFINCGQVRLYTRKNTMAASMKGCICFFLLPTLTFLSSLVSLSFQNCIAAERFYVQEGIYNKFVAEVTKRVKSLSQGATNCSADSPRCDFGAITMPAQADIFQALINDAVEKGAKIETGGSKYVGDHTKKGLYFAPTILTGVTHKMKIANEEAFGPVMSIIKFKTEEEVVRIKEYMNTERGCILMDQSKSVSCILAFHSSLIPFF